jgi:SAM-dependent methyltransferase
VNDAEFGLLDEIEEDHWWFVGKRLILTTLLERHAPDGPLLDLGCGTGGLLRDWSPQRRCVGVDGSRLALQICRRKGFSCVARSELVRAPFESGTFDAILALDVIEHLDDDVACLKEAARLCGAEGRLIVSVPAFQWLWSQHDETFEHKRRYTAAQLEHVVRRAGLEAERITYTNALLLPVAAVWRIVSYRLGVGRFAPKHDFWAIPRWLNALLVHAYRLETWLLRSFDLPLGLSVVCIARTPQTNRSPQSSAPR